MRASDLKKAQTHLTNLEKIRETKKKLSNSNYSLMITYQNGCNTHINCQMSVAEMLEHAERVEVSVLEHMGVLIDA